MKVLVLSKWIVLTVAFAALVTVLILFSVPEKDINQEQKQIEIILPEGVKS